LKILVLDDDKIRLDHFRRGLIGYEVTTTETASDTISLLSTHDFDVIFLDHDLGGKINEPSGPGTGYEVAEWLHNNPNRKPKQIFIHSFNEPGRKRMKVCLPEAVECPGEWLKFK
jgi:CheY-like chemotaxis protein